MVPGAAPGAKRSCSSLISADRQSRRLGSIAVPIGGVAALLTLEWLHELAVLAGLWVGILVLLGLGAVVCNGSVCDLSRFVGSEVVQRAIEELKERVATAGRKTLRLARPNAERRRNMADMVRLCVVIRSTIVNYSLR